ncbi:MAG: nucleoside deaminase [Elusimicrobia bacterium]|nr:nucleoside deaminase [Elusimicrobiota bacterium]
MKRALELANRAYDSKEIPVGAVVVKEGSIVGEGHNRQMIDSDPTAHAEIVALRQASSKENNFRLDDMDIYVTVKPCRMCREAISRARIRRVYYLSPQARECTHNAEYSRMSGYGDESTGILKKFFMDRR